MATDRNFSDYQRKIIGRYYENQPQLDQQRLSELVTNLYLSEGKKRDKHWVTAREMMTRLKVPADRIEHIMKSADPALLAEVVQDLQAGRLSR